jgi:hypothetical protein
MAQNKFMLKKRLFEVAKVLEIIHLVLEMLKYCNFKLTIEGASTSLFPTHRETKKNSSAFKLCEVIPNVGKEHAVVMMSKIFDKTITSVKMLVGSLDSKIAAINSNTNHIFDWLKQKSPLEKGRPFAKMVF